MKGDIAVVGSINLDVIVKTPSYPNYGETVFCNEIDFRPGGKGANQAVTISKMQQNPLMIGAVGKDSSGKQVLENLKRKGIDASYILSVNNVTGSFIAMIDKFGENTMVGTKGANEAITESYIDSVFSQIEASILLIQMETSKESILASVKAAKERGIYVVLDPAPADGIFHEVFPYVDLILPNQQETKKITSVEVTDKKSAEKAADKLHLLGISNAMVKMGSEGVLVSVNGVKTFIDSINVKAVDTVGAGDCFAGVVASQLLYTKDLVKVARLATIAAGIKVSRPGGHDSLPTLKEVKTYKVKE